jgi:hypothetical protein
MKAQKLIVTARELNYSETGEKDSYHFPVYEFENGLILVVGDTTNDWFFDSRDEIEPNGTAVTESVQETGEFSDWDKGDLIESIKASLNEFGSLPDKALQLL